MIYRQTKNSGNSYWTQKLYKHRLITGPGSSFAEAIILQLDSNDISQREITVREGMPIYLKWIMTYNFNIYFYTHLAGLESITPELNDYSFYLNSDGVMVDITGSSLNNISAGSGADVLGREGHQIITSNQFAESVEYYYIKYIPHISGDMGFYIYGD